MEGLRGMVKDIGNSHGAARGDVSTAPTEAPTTTDEHDTTHLLSELPDARSWRDYVTQYWTANPACHQYRAGVDMLPHERKAHRSGLSRMRIVAEFVHDAYGGDLDRFDVSFGRCVEGS